MRTTTPDEPTAARESFGDIAPALAASTDTISGWPTANTALTIVRRAFEEHAG